MKRFRIKAGLAAFILVVPALLGTALIDVACPVCNGTGEVSGNQGAENVSIVSFEFTEQKIQRDTCGVYIVFRYGATMSALNEGDTDVDTWFKMQLIDTFREEGSNIVDTQYVQFHIPAKSVVNNSFDVVFGTGLDEPRRTEVMAEVVEGGVPDTTCNGTGKVPLNAWPFVNALKDSFTEVVRNVNTYHPPVAIDWDDYVFFDQ
jgi:hypothetical protein